MGLEYSPRGNRYGPASVDLIAGVRSISQMHLSLRCFVLLSRALGRVVHLVIFFSCTKVERDEAFTLQAPVGVHHRDGDEATRTIRALFFGRQGGK